jgi:outer membrane protein
LKAKNKTLNPKSQTQNIKQQTMTNTFRKALLIIASATALNTAVAQKTAHVSLDSLVGLMPETKVAKDAAQNYLKGIENEIMTMESELQNKYKDYMDKSAGMSDLLKRNKEEELTSIQKRIEEFRGQAQEDYRRKYAEITAPIMEKAKKAIEMVAKEAGYKYVLDTSPQAQMVLYSEPTDDILMLVKKKLDTMPPANIPGTTATNMPPQKTPAPKTTTPPKAK